MAAFFTRIELHDGNSSDYAKLHAAMKISGFYQAIIGHDGTTIRVLPTAEYYKTSTNSCNYVSKEARNAANSTNLKNIVLTMEIIKWSGDFDPAP